MSTLASALKFDSDRSFVVIATYAALSRGGALASKLTHLPTSTMLIADEAHNSGAGSVRKQLQGVPCEKRLALSATLKRRFDIDGDLALENFFEDQPPYAYEYSLEAAIQNKVLTKYSYHPVLVELTQEEMETFSKISLEIAKLYDPKKKVFRNPDYAKHLLDQTTHLEHLRRAARTNPCPHPHYSASLRHRGKCLGSLQENVKRSNQDLDCTQRWSQ